MATDVNSGYVTTLLFDLERARAHVAEELRQAEARARTVDAELLRVLGRLDAVRLAIAEARGVIVRAGGAIADRNDKMTSLHREMATFQRKAEELRTAMDAARDDEAKRRLRRARAVQTVQVQERQKKVDKLKEEADAERARLQRAEATMVSEGDKQRRIEQELDALQAQLPSPHLYMRRAEIELGRAHAMYFLEGNNAAWHHDTRQVIDHVLALHVALRSGRYRIDKNSDVLGGRAAATAEAVYAALAHRDPAMARRLFDEATDPGMSFHQIYHVFRTWCAGLYVAGRHAELRDLAELHQDSQGSRGGFAQAYLALLDRDAERFAHAYKSVVVGSWDIWQRSSDPSMGLVCVPGLALLTLARDARLRLPTWKHVSVPTKLAQSK